MAQTIVSNCLLEDHLILTLPRVEDIKTQLSKHKFTVIFLEPTEFETIATEDMAWKQFINELNGPT